MAESLLNLIANPKVISPHGSYREGVREAEAADALKAQRALEQSKLKSYTAQQQRLATLAQAAPGSPEHKAALMQVTAYNPQAGLSYQQAVEGVEESEQKAMFKNIFRAGQFADDPVKWDAYVNLALQRAQNNPLLYQQVLRLKDLKTPEERRAGVAEAKQIAITEGLFEPDQKGVYGGRYSKSAPIITKVDGKYQIVTPVTDKTTGTVTLEKSPLSEETKIVSRQYGEDPLAKQTRDIVTAGGKEKAVQAAELEGEPKTAKAVALAEGSVAEFFERKNAAEDAVVSLRSVQEARSLLDQGIISGFGANFIVGLGKALQQAGIEFDSDAIANTEAFAAAQAKQVATIIKDFGAGTGLSDADREFALKAAAGDITMTEKSIRRILDINERANINMIKRYNKEMAGIDSKFKPLEISKPVSFKDKVVMKAHPQYGDITEGDILQTMKDTKSSREEVLKRLEF